MQVVLSQFRYQIVIEISPLSNDKMSLLAYVLYNVYEYFISIMVFTIYLPHQSALIITFDIIICRMKFMQRYRTSRVLSFTFVSYAHI